VHRVGDQPRLYYDARSTNHHSLCFDQLNHIWSGVKIWKFFTLLFCPSVCRTVGASWNSDHPTDCLTPHGSLQQSALVDTASVEQSDGLEKCYVVLSVIYKLKRIAVGGGPVLPLLTQYQHLKCSGTYFEINPLNAELNFTCYLLALLGAHPFLHVTRIRLKSLTLRLLMSYIYGTPILDVSRSHTTTHHSR